MVVVRGTGGTIRSGKSASTGGVPAIADPSRMMDRIRPYNLLVNPPLPSGTPSEGGTIAPTTIPLVPPRMVTYATHPDQYCSQHTCPITPTPGSLISTGPITPYNPNTTSIPINNYYNSPKKTTTSPNSTSSVSTSIITKLAMLTISNALYNAEMIVIPEYCLIVTPYILH